MYNIRKAHSVAKTTLHLIIYECAMALSLVKENLQVSSKSVHTECKIWYLRREQALSVYWTKKITAELAFPPNMEYKS